MIQRLAMFLKDLNIVSAIISYFIFCFFCGNILKNHLNIIRGKCEYQCWETIPFAKHKRPAILVVYSIQVRSEAQVVGWNRGKWKVFRIAISGSAIRNNAR